MKILAICGGGLGYKTWLQVDSKGPNEVMLLPDGETVANCHPVIEAAQAHVDVIGGIKIGDLICGVRWTEGYYGQDTTNFASGELVVKVHNRTKYEPKEIQEFTLLKRVKNNWRERDIVLYQHPEDEGLVVSVGTSFDGKVVVIVIENKTDWKRELDDPNEEVVTN
jgi:hypothetical protein